MDKSLEGFALDLGGTKLAAARFSKNQLVEKAQIPTQADAPFEDQCAAMEKLLANLGFRHGDRLGVALTGRVDQNGLWSAVNGETLPQIKNIDVRNALQLRFGDRVSLINDAAAAACGEAHFGAGRNISRFGYITISTGVGGGIVLDGQPLISPNGLAGHIGFMRSPLGDQMCGSGRFGTVESVAGGRALAAAAAALGHEEFDAKAIYAAHQDGSQWASQLITRAAHAIAIQIADLTSIFALQRIAIGGSIGLADGFIQLITDQLTAEPAIFQPEIHPAKLGSDSPLFGALCVG
jgi:N-acylmannosamine kinase